MSWWQPLVGAGAGLLGSYFSGRSAQQGQEDANRQNIELFERNQAFQREVLQNRTQWWADDLEKAGFNRLLATGTPAGAAPGGMTRVESTRKEATRFQIEAASALSSIALQRELKKTERTKQSLNLAQEDRIRGGFSIPGVYSTTAKDLMQGRKSIGYAFRESYPVKGLINSAAKARSINRLVPGRQWMRYLNFKRS